MSRFDAAEYELQKRTELARGKEDERQRNLAAWSEVVGATFDPATAEVINAHKRDVMLTDKGKAILESAALALGKLL